MLSFVPDGAQLFSSAAVTAVDSLRRAFASFPTDRAGVRLSDLRFAREVFRSDGPVGQVASAVLGAAARPVRAIYFDKSEQTNWALDWHQDRTICVQERADLPGFGPWTIKSGLPHVTPPFDVLSRMVTLRVHLDAVHAENAPLLIAPGSHQFGRVAEPQIARAVAKAGIYACLAELGDVWLYSTPILHASETASKPSRRRVLQLDYAAFDLPHGLRWRELI